MAASQPPTVPITALAFSPDGLTLLSNGPRRIDVRSPHDAAVQYALPCHLPKLTSLVFHPRGHILAVAGGGPGVNGEVLLLDWPAQTTLRRLTNHHDLATCVVFNADGTLLAWASSDHMARVWRTANESTSWSEAFALSGHAGPVLAIAFSPTGRTIVTASADRSIKVWSTEDGRLLRTFSHHIEPVNALAFRPQARTSAETPPCLCASASDDRTLRIWQPEIGRMVRIIRRHRAPIFALAFSPDGKFLYSAGKDAIIRRLDADSDIILAEWPAHNDWIYALAISPDGSKLASGDWSGAVRLRDLRREE